MQMRQNELLIMQRIRISSATRLELANRQYGLRGRAPKHIHHNWRRVTELVQAGAHPASPSLPRKEGKMQCQHIMLMRHHALSNDESKPKLGYHASSNQLRCRAPPGPASAAPRPNTTIGDESGIQLSLTTASTAVRQ